MVRIKLADIPVQMNNVYPDLEELCRGYETQEEPKIVLSVSQEEIEEERAQQTYVFTNGYLESVCFYRKLAFEVLSHGVFVLHASIIEVDGQGYAFLAPSGTGKTTQTRLWLEWFGDNARVINGDKPLVRMARTSDSVRFIAYGTPWCGKEGMHCNASVPLKALFLLERAEVPGCTVIDQERLVELLFRQILMPEQEGQMELLLQMLDEMVEKLPSYHLKCNMTLESVKVAYDAAKDVKNKKY